MRGRGESRDKIRRGKRKQERRIKTLPKRKWKEMERWKDENKDAIKR